MSNNKDDAAAAAALLAAEIARIEVEIARRKELEDEIAATQAAIQNAAATKKTKIIKRIVRRRRQRPSSSQQQQQQQQEQEDGGNPQQYESYVATPQQPHHCHGRMTRRASYAANPDQDMAQFQRQRLQQEIDEMHRLYQEQRLVYKQQLQQQQLLDCSDESLTVHEVGPPQLQSQAKQQYTDHDNYDDDNARRQLEAEIAALQATITAAQTTSPTTATIIPKRRRSLPVTKRPATRVSTVNAGLSQSLHHYNSSSNHSHSSRRDEMTKQEQLENEIQTMQNNILQRRSVKSSKSSNLQPNTAPSIQSPIRATNYNNVLLLNALTTAAKKRDKRLQESQGQQLHFQKHRPVLSTAASTSSQVSFELAQLVSIAARRRTERLDNGGEAKMTAIRERVDDGDKDYKNDFATVVREAAELGRLTRLNEVVVEAVAQEKTPAQQWKSQGLLAIQWRSSYMSIIQEAANLGNEVKLPEHVVGNFDDDDKDDQWGSGGNHDDADDVRMSDRKKQLLELSGSIGHGMQKVDRFMNVKRHEGKELTSSLVRPMQAYRNIDDVVLPRERPPKIDPKQALFKLENEERPMIDMARYVAMAAWERRARLDRPNMMPKMKEKCNCVYCDQASPYQTYAYKIREERRKETGHDNMHGAEQGLSYDTTHYRRNVQRSRSVSPSHDMVDSASISPQRAKATFAHASAHKLATGTPDATSSPRRRFVAANGTIEHSPGKQSIGTDERDAGTFIDQSMPGSSVNERMEGVSDKRHVKPSEGSRIKASGPSGHSPSRRPKVKGVSPKSSPGKSPTRKNRKKLPKPTAAGFTDSQSSSPRAPLAERCVSESTSATITVTPDSTQIAPPPLSPTECASSSSDIQKPVHTIEIPIIVDDTHAMKALTKPKPKRGLLGKLFGGRKKHLR